MQLFEPLRRLRSANVAIAVLLVIAGLSNRCFSAEDSNGISLKDASRLLRQSRESDANKGEKQCGISCLYLFLELHGSEPNLSEIEKLVPIGEHGASLQSLAEASRQLGVRASPTLCNPADWSALPLPAIAHLERLGDEKPYMHYVVITNATERGVDLFDPFDNRTRFFNYAQLGTVFSGYCLVATPHPLGRPGTLLGLAGLLLASFGIWRIARTRRGGGTGSGYNAPIRAAGAGLVVAAAFGMAGCDRAELSVPDAERSATDNVPAREPASPIEVENGMLKLGHLQPKSLVDGEFRFRNTSSAPVTLRLGPTDCSCVNAELQPDGVLAPGAEGRLVVHLDTGKHNQAGHLEACASVLVDNEKHQQKFCVTGVLEGIVFRNTMYVVRPQQRLGGEIPSLDFTVVTYDDGTDFRLSDITCASLEEFSKAITGGDRIDTELLTAKSPLAARLAEATVSPPQTPTGEAYKVFHVSVPMHLDDSVEASGGMIIVDYVVAGRKMQAVTRLLVVAERT